MSRFKGISDLNCKFYDLVGGKCAPANKIFQRLALQHFHHDELPAFMLTYVMNSADVWMVQRGSSLRLPAETGERVPVASDVFRQELERDKAAEPSIFGLVHNTHPATTKLFHDAVVRDGLGDE
jgi:hypothetical protein